VHYPALDCDYIALCTKPHNAQKVVNNYYIFTVSVYVDPASVVTTPTATKPCSRSKLIYVYANSNSDCNFLPNQCKSRPVLTFQPNPSANSGTFGA